MKRKIFAFAFILELLFSGSAFAEIISGPDVAVVEVEGGKLQGYIHDGIFTYHGVPYAEADLFMPPVKVKPWDGIKMAVTYGAVSPQNISQAEDMFPAHWYWPHWEPKNYTQSNNCQNLNIWTPGLDDKKRPVMIWIHGGGFEAGSSSVEDVYDGENLSRKGDVVVISVNHRLNVLGFLDLSAYGDEYKYSGNLGIMDLVAALEWVNKNIAKFGGDPDNVTLFGQSGGGAKILTLMAVPAAKNLFHKAIEQSGAVELMGITLPEQKAARRVAELTLKNLNISPEKISELKNVPYSKLIEAANKAMAQAKEDGEKIYSWSPVRDGDYIPDDPVEGGFPEQAKNIPLLIGSCLNEWATVPLFANMPVTQSDNKNFWTDSQISAKLKDKYGDKADAVVNAFKKAYPNKKAVDALYVDTWLRTRAIKTMNAKFNQNGASVYAYVFTWETPVMGGYAMAYHCSELPFVFNNIALSETATGGGERAQALADKVSKAWIDFARTGNPGWKAYTQSEGATMIFDDEPVLAYNHDAELMKLLMPDYNY
ncbi:MAG: carboxylesterase/lipase family protein [Synergistaceae bacterium]|nr:carboxylesterase/lipase family protein [Synergistaceae bacterium]MBR0044078.1 carboxylesterase/lipase family protein [Synergistaceae bacterium]MBR0096414.1 carboxylesterase/lipase family protein [Synergistaceae bacterium]